MNTNQRQIILKSWSNVDEVSIIKDVATKGEHVDMCLEYLQKKKQITLEESTIFFHKIIDIYVQRLIQDKLVIKAENVLKNVGRNFVPIYYQYYFENNLIDETAKQLVLKHLEKKEKNFQNDYSMYKFYWWLIQMIEENDELKLIFQLDFKNLETFVKLSDFERENLIIKLYLKTNNDEIFKKITINGIWNNLILTANYEELIIWLYFQKTQQANNFADDDKINSQTNFKSRLDSKDDIESGIMQSSTQLSSERSSLTRKDNLQNISLDKDSNLDDCNILPKRNFYRTKITKTMFKFGCENLLNPPEVLKDLFAINGYLFKEEENDFKKILQRFLRTGTLNKNKEILNKLPKFLYDQKLYELLLEENFITHDEIEKLSQIYPDDDFLQIIKNLKYNSLSNMEDFLLLSKISTNFLLKNNPNLELNPIILLAEFLADNRKPEDLSGIDNSLNELCVAEKIKSLPEHLKFPLIEFLRKRAACDPFEDISEITVNKLFKKFHHIDIDEISKLHYGDQLPSFSNSLLVEKYGKTLKLNYFYYLKQQRPGLALYSFLLEQLRNYSQITKSQLYGSAEICTEMALNHYQNENLFIHFVAFIEMIGFDTQNLRTIAKLLKSSPKMESQKLNSQELIDEVQSKLFSGENLTDDNANAEFPLEDFTNLMRISKSYSNGKIPDLYLKRLAKNNDWWRLLLFIQYFDIPLNDVINITKYFGIAIMGEHLFRGLSYNENNQKSKKKTNMARQKVRVKNENNSTTTTTSGGDMTSSMSSNKSICCGSQNSLFKTNQQMKFLQNSSKYDIFALIIMSWSSIPAERVILFSKFLEIIYDETNQYSMSLNLMKNSIKYKSPALSVLATLVDNDLNTDWFWLCWLGITIDNFILIQTIGKDFKFISIKIIEFCVRNGYVKILHRSFAIFFKENKFNHLLQFLKDTENLKFSDEAMTWLRLYYVSWSNNELQLPLVSEDLNKDELMHFSVKLLVLHLKFNFTSFYHQQQFLDLISKSGISDITPNTNFNLLCKVQEILSHTSIKFDFEVLLESHSSNNYNDKNDNNQNNKQAFEKLISKLVEIKEFDKAIEMSLLFNLEVSDIVYQKWIELDWNKLDFTNFNFEMYESEVSKYLLPPEFLVNFYLYASNLSTCKLKYLLMKKSLDVIKKDHLFPNETFNRDQIEYDMILCYLECDDFSELEIYHSEYYEEIMCKEKLVLFKSFSELKELAGIYDLTTTLKFKLTGEIKEKFYDLLNQLLDLGDIIEALRLQAMFECPTVDLRYLVFCMALGEGLTSIYNLTDEERLMFLNMDKNIKVKFDKRIFDNAVSTPTKDTSIQENYSEFEEIPSKEKQEILEVVQCFASSLKHGIHLGQRIVLVYRSAMYLDKEYVDVLRTKDTNLMLKSASEDDCLKKLLVISDIFIANKMGSEEIAEYLGNEIATSIIRPVFYIFTANHQVFGCEKSKIPQLWGYDLNKEFHLFLELCPNTAMLGNSLLQYCDVLKTYRKYQDNQEYEYSETFGKLSEIIKKYGLPTNTNSIDKQTQVLSHKKHNTIYVELLIKAHECFTHECSMEGLADVLNRTKIVATILANAKSWKLIVRLLTGIGRYREMFYCFDILLKNDQFEFLLGQFDEMSLKGLRYAILNYCREYCPQNHDLFKLVALHFLMYKDLAEMWEKEANLIMSKIKEESFDKSSKKIRCSVEIQKDLDRILECLTQATENYLLDNKLRPAMKCANRAELAAMQIHFASKNLNTTCPYLLEIQNKNEFREFINCELDVSQAIIFKKAYSEFDINWAEALLSQYIILGRNEYLEEFNKYMDLTDALIEDVIKGFQSQAHTLNITPKMEENLSNLINFIQSIILKYKLASLLGLKNVIKKIINSDSNYYLKDTNYGRNEIN